MVNAFCTDSDLCKFVASAASSLRIEGSGAHRGFGGNSGDEPLSLQGYSGLIEHSPDDMVVTVRAGTMLKDLQHELALKGQGLPLQMPEGFPNGTVGGAISMGLPHLLEARHGSWRDWVLGLRILLADGTVAKCGSRAVKNVAGYDLQKLIVGSRGSLAIILEATLRTAPLRAYEASLGRLVAGEPGALSSIQRVRRSDFATALEASRRGLLFACPDSGTLWLCSNPFARFPDDWVIRSDAGDANVEIRNATQLSFMLRAKEVFDPKCKFNPREWEFM